MKDFYPFGFKNLNVMSEALKHPWHPILIALHRWLIMRYSKIILTGSWRPGGGIHSMIPLRAEDIRSRVFDDPEGIEKDINAHWVYDPERPKYKVALYHNTGKGLHFHIQVHDNTVYIGSLK